MVEEKLRYPWNPLIVKWESSLQIQDSRKLKVQLIKGKKLDAKYKKAILKEITTKSKYFNSDEYFLTYRLLKKHENMFDGTWGNYTDIEYNIELLEGARMYHVKSFPIPKLH